MCHGVRLGGALPPVWAQAVPGAPPPREMCEELPGEQEANQQQNGNEKINSGKFRLSRMIDKNIFWFLGEDEVLVI